MIKKLAFAIVVITIASLSIAGCIGDPPNVSPSPTAAKQPTISSTPTPSKKPTPTVTPTPSSKPITPSVTPNPAKKVTPTPSPTSTTSFFVGSKNSNVYHYPTCPEALKIKPGNVVKFPSIAEAKAAGYHPCQKCHPPS